MAEQDDAFKRSTMVMISAAIFIAGVVGGTFLIPASPAFGAMMGLVIAILIVVMLLVVND